jgi:hypothetical protein
MVATVWTGWLLACWGLVAQAAGSNTEGAKAVSQLQPVRVQRSALFAVYRRACVCKNDARLSFHTRLCQLIACCNVLITIKQTPGLLQQFEAAAARPDIQPRKQHLHYAT